MNASLAATDRLKLRIRVESSLSAMNSRMSGWSTRSMPMLAPRRVPPCLIASVATSNTCISDTGPEAVPPVDATRSRSEEHTSELQSPCNLVCRLLLEKKKLNEFKRPLYIHYRLLLFI